mmetsp:Transcript_25142/g.43045  ORF Transcript_25142/g.43045 Transcript_25142/m.43045 type:complete len:259 (-) Transcript_25142:830-1606(-)
MIHWTGRECPPFHAVAGPGHHARDLAVVVRVEAAELPEKRRAVADRGRAGAPQAKAPAAPRHVTQRRRRGVPALGRAAAAVDAVRRALRPRRQSAVGAVRARRPAEALAGLAPLHDPVAALGAPGRDVGARRRQGVVDGAAHLGLAVLRVEHEDAPERAVAVVHDAPGLPLPLLKTVGRSEIMPDLVRKGLPRVAGVPRHPRVLAPFAECAQVREANGFLLPAVVKQMPQGVRLRLGPRSKACKLRLNAQRTAGALVP